MVYVHTFIQTRESKTKQLSTDNFDTILLGTHSESKNGQSLFLEQRQNDGIERAMGFAAKQKQ